MELPVRDSEVRTVLICNCDGTIPAKNVAVLTWMSRSCRRRLPPPQPKSMSLKRDWYNLEKSKRVKPFRCGEFNDCIERAATSQGIPPKKREKSYGPHLEKGFAYFGPVGLH
ncbi:hypothetical protein SSX86_028868 [Deinandra increscens subsp. villosa]|uniref:Uncharacterized protein n=1 Tax=Deinandra increscens subsp. villosa TaxID=3103831 RepID=A0AAP0C9F8_9ASTR